MRFSSAIILLGAASAVVATTAGQRSSLMAIRGVMERQLTICKPVPAPATCEKSCGPGNIQCISFPNCYNPSAGESCCSNGKYCPADYYCTDAGCCPVGSTLDECGATFTLSVIPPPAATTTPPVAETTSSAEAATTTSSTSTSTSTASESPTSTSSSSFSTYIPSTYVPVPTPTTSSSSTSSSNATATTSGPIQVTNAAQKVGSDAVQIALGGLGVLFMML